MVNSTVPRKQFNNFILFGLFGLVVVALAQWLLFPRRIILVRFDWDQRRGFQRSEILGPVLYRRETIYRRKVGKLLADEAKPWIAAELKKRGWQSGRGEIAIRTLGFVPICLGLDRTVQWRVYDPQETSLMEASLGCQPQRLKRILAAGADANARDQEGHTALIYAIKDSTSCAETVGILLSTSIDVNAKDKMGRTALSWAVSNVVHPEIVNQLIRAGADVNAQDQEGTPVLIQAISAGGDESAAAQAAKLLIDGGANLNAKDSEGHTALHVAEAMHRDAIWEMLRQAGALR